MTTTHTNIFQDERGKYNFWDLPLHWYDGNHPSFTGPFDDEESCAAAFTAHQHEIATLNCAQALAELIHLGQVDKQGRPIIEHIQRVYRACRSLGLEQRVAAILHESLEDASDKISYSALDFLFGEDTSRIVNYLTRFRTQRYERYIDRIIFYRSAIPIKLADLNDNLDERRGPIPESLRERYLKARERLEKAYSKIGGRT